MLHQKAQTAAVAKPDHSPAKPTTRQIAIERTNQLRTAILIFEAMFSVPSCLVGDCMIAILHMDVNTKISDMAKKVGRPAGKTKDRLFQMRAEHDWIIAIDEWRKQQPGELLTRTEAVRRLVEQALSAAVKKR